MLPKKEIYKNIQYHKNVNLKKKLLTIFKNRPRARQHRFYNISDILLCHVGVRTIGMPVVLLVGEASGAAEEGSQRGFGGGTDADGIHLIRT